MSHFSAVLLYALFASIVIGITQRAEPRRMIQFGALCFGIFVVSTIAVSWIMFAIAH